MSARYSIRDAVNFLAIISLVFAFVIFFRKMNERFQDLETVIITSQAAQTFEVHASLVQENFIDGGATYTVNKLDVINEGATVSGFVYEIAYDLPCDIPDERVSGTLVHWLSPLTSYCGALNPARTYNWSQPDVQPDLLRSSANSLRSGIIRVEMRFSPTPAREQGYFN